MPNSQQAERVAVITGAAGALGSHFARRLAADGYHIAIADVVVAEATAAAVRALGREAYAEAVDLADADAVRRFAASVLERFGRCDLIVNNAAHMPLVPWAELSLDEFRRFEAVNVEAPLLLAQALTPGMVERGWGRIVQIASSTIGTPMPGFAAYVTTKMAGIGLTRALAAEFGDLGITVNAVCPGLTRTPSSEQHIPAALFEAVRQAQLIKRTEEPQDLCGIVAFLASRDSDFITGQTFYVDGGINF
ncbi:SDR family NAD(P)-dependent oxidoreductase [Vogesella facilis]|uniref:SDR family NAD(P)-dependent oxidoreductase n=1 Tax=Vogesella facilis TaxID=1655232 RepID=A0ABV7RAZ7_9NEIS